MHDTSRTMDEVFDDDIDSLDARIEALAAEILRCRKIALAARVAIGGGAVWSVLMLVRAMPMTPEMLLAALGAVIGGIVLLGSNASSWEQAEAARATAETARRQLIGRLELRVVGEERPTVH